MSCSVPATNFLPNARHHFHAAPNLDITHCMHTCSETSFPPSSHRPSFAVEGTLLFIPEEFNFDVASWKVGDYVDCTALSETMRPFGGFPSSLLVRKEMKVVWSLVLDGIIKRESKWVLAGSPGVGKSVLTVLLCFHLAQVHGASVFLARKLKGEFEGPQRGSVAICIHPGGRAVGYPKDPDENIDLKAISREFGKPYKRPALKTTVLDGWSQSALEKSSVGEEFEGFDLLATSVQYGPRHSSPGDVTCVEGQRPRITVESALIDALHFQ